LRNHSTLIIPFQVGLSTLAVTGQVANRLREFAVIRALEMKMAAAAATSGQGESVAAARLEAEAVQSARAGESSYPCKLRLKTAQVSIPAHSASSQSSTYFTTLRLTGISSWKPS
jgi:hypothetical protein